MKQIKVEAKIRAVWKSLKEFHDIQTISMRTGINRVSISNAINGKPCSAKTFLAVNEYFIEKKRKIQESKKAIAA